MAEGARLESVFRGNSNVGSNPTLSAIPHPACVSYSGLGILWNSAPLDLHERLLQFGDDRALFPIHQRFSVRAVALIEPDCPGGVLV